MAKLNTLRKDDILRAITLPDPSPHAAPLKRFSSIEEPSVDEALKKLARGGDDYQNLREYARALIKRWDTNYDGAISFQELCDGMKALDIHLALKDRVALMKKLDLNRDGELSDIELYKAI
jgi:Ca2+-binding EF-hand superfamily protein